MFGAILLVGAIGLIDLRMLGFAKGLPLAALMRALTPLGLAGFAMMVVSGLLLFVADVRALLRSDLFGLKLGLVAIAGANALAFHLWLKGGAGPVTMAQRLSAAASLVLWCSVVAAGRLIAYF